MTVQSTKATSTQANIKKKFPVDEGLTLGTTKLDGQESALKPEQDLTTNQHWGGI